MKTRKAQPGLGSVPVALAAVASAVALALTATPALATAACGNEAIRAEQEAFRAEHGSAEPGTAATPLPECRAYELVSPGGSPLVSSEGRVHFGVRAATTGSAIAYFSYYPDEANPTSGFFFRSARGHDGWSVEAASPQNEEGGFQDLVCEPEVDYSPDLLQSVLGDGWEVKQEVPGGSPCARPQEELVPGEPAGFRNLYLREVPGGPYTLVNAPGGASPGNAQFLDASTDFSHIVFGEAAELTPGAPAGEDLYDWDGGSVHLVSVVPPDHTAVEGELAGSGELHDGETTDHLDGSDYKHAVSADGERVVFDAGGKLYLRENATQEESASGECGEAEPQRACTVEIDASGGLGNSGGGVFQYASAEASRVFFTDESKLTPEATATTGKPDLYEYDVESRALTDLTADASEPANVRGLSGASEDGSYIYFVAEGALTGGQPNSQGAVAQPKQPNLYLDHEHALTFIATLDPNGDGDDWQEITTGGTMNTGLLTARTSPNGQVLAFNSRNPLTGFDNTPAAPADCSAAGSLASGPCTEIFAYEAASGELSCASCAPDGAQPTAPTEIGQPVSSSEHTAGERGERSALPPAYGRPVYLPRNVSEDGQVFFTTTDALLPQDENDVSDVYEWHAGELQLISDSADSGPSVFLDASVSGEDVFFATPDALVRADAGGGVERLYDARVEGGFTEPPSASSACEGEACHGPASSIPDTGAASTARDTGPGNQPPPPATKCKKGFVKRDGRCVKQAKRHKQKKKAVEKCKDQSGRRCATMHKHRSKAKRHGKPAGGRRAAGKGRRARR